MDSPRDTDDDFDNSSDESWIEWFCGLDGNQYLCEVDEDFIDDEFNIYGLSSYFTYYQEALDVIMSVAEPESFVDKDILLIKKEAALLYGLIHARYILTSSGLKKMYAKYRKGEFGGCPRVLCDNHAVLPVGTSDIPYIGETKLFCPKCGEEYSIPQGFVGSSLDGSYFGTTFPHLLMLNVQGIQEAQKYKPTVFGFLVRKEAAPPGVFRRTKERLCVFDV
ncbi:casein kinase II subunit beta-3, putative [Entamoeba invadens IP1]|uniref:Casein kinase II subunit beta n=1 Tax=Entamoeba invadens IP1 TaxID=370355 RepID=A0A0A1U1B9_ENTIV|nr:casein kinase II subunit beta-3, putative [Entamoeba invadens IP1]ELP84703.1 casein kinase II subunit beta-3, putative [Entamoeba invadens IP1]|eukprot:XP_004184049.1 casein kinase II subunit beta-3, putative [Entamoeba invadens IP1]